MSSIYDILKERGFVQQQTHEEPLTDKLAKEKVTVYAGFDPTADSLHVGHMIPIMLLAHFQRAGHRIIAVAGGGTVLIGDPSGKTDMRKMLTFEQIEENLVNIKKQLGRFMNLDGEAGLLVNNADWIRPLNYVEFLRDIGTQFSVNKMLTAECFKSRLEKGLSFIEFNYMLLQGYDFLVLNRKYNCNLQVGGDDQWSNILAGIDLIRRKEQKEAYGLTAPLLTTATGKKMGKTESGSIWLDPARTTPFEFYQYFRNTHDADVIKLLKLFTFLPMDEIRKYEALEGKELNTAKKVLAYEITAIIHGKEEADNAQKAAESLFEKGGAAGSIPTSAVTAAELANGYSIIDALKAAGFAPTNSEARRLIQGGGIYVNEEKVEQFDKMLFASDVQDGRIALRKGKKSFHHLIAE